VESIQKKENNIRIQDAKGDAHQIEHSY